MWLRLCSDIGVSFLCVLFYGERERERGGEAGTGREINGGNAVGRRKGRKRWRGRERQRKGGKEARRSVLTLDV